MSNIFSVYDDKAKFFSPIFLVPNDATAIRIFYDTMQPATHRADYNLYRVGQWDDETGIITPQDPEIIMPGRSLVYDDQLTEEETPQ